MIISTFVLPFSEESGPVIYGIGIAVAASTFLFWDSLNKRRK